MQKFGYIFTALFLLSNIKPKFINLDDDATTKNPDRPYISDYLYRMLVIGSFGLVKIDLLINLISHQPDINKI